MILNENQIIEVDSLIIEGELAMNFLPVGKKKFICKANEKLKSFCSDNNEDYPDFLSVNVPPSFVGNDDKTGQEEKVFYSNLLPFYLNMLRELRTGYYLRKQLEENIAQTKEAHRQTEEATNQTKEAQKANKRTCVAIFISVIAVFLSACAIYISLKPNVIKIEEKQYQEIKTVHEKKDSLAIISPISKNTKN